MTEPFHPDFIRALTKIDQEMIIEEGGDLPLFDTTLKRIAIRYADDHFWYPDSEILKLSFEEKRGYWKWLFAETLGRLYEHYGLEKPSIRGWTWLPKEV